LVGPDDAFKQQRVTCSFLGDLSVSVCVLADWSLKSLISRPKARIKNGSFGPPKGEIVAGGSISFT
jgi:hypothetical protein